MKAQTVATKSVLTAALIAAYALMFVIEASRGV